MLLHDYITLMLANLTAGLFVLGVFLLGWDGKEDDLSGRNRMFAAPFGLVGLIGLATGLHMVLAWPLPKGTPVAWANIGFGEPMVMFGGLFAAAAVALACRWRLGGVGLYALVSGAVAVLIGVRILDLGYTRSAAMTATGFILAGAGGALTCAAALAPKIPALRKVAGVVLLLGALSWIPTTFGAYWGHLGPKFHGGPWDKTPATQPAQTDTQPARSR